MRITDFEVEQTTKDILFPVPNLWKPVGISAALGWPLLAPHGAMAPVRQPLSLTPNMPLTPVSTWQAS